MLTRAYSASLMWRTTLPEEVTVRLRWHLMPMPEKWWDESSGIPVRRRPLYSYVYSVPDFQPMPMPPGPPGPLEDSMEAAAKPGNYDNVFIKDVFKVIWHAVLYSPTKARRAKNLILSRSVPDGGPRRSAFLRNLRGFYTQIWCPNCQAQQEKARQHMNGFTRTKSVFGFIEVRRGSIVLNQQSRSAKKYFFSYPCSRHQG